MTTSVSQLALSIRQPWAWLIIRPDITDLAARILAEKNKVFKDFENRVWKSHYKGLLLIHASSGFTRLEYVHCKMFLEVREIPITLPPFKSFDLGGIIGRVVMHGSTPASESKWFTGPFGFSFQSPHILPFKKFSGRQRFFNVPA